MVEQEVLFCSPVTKSSNTAVYRSTAGTSCWACAKIHSGWKAEPTMMSVRLALELAAPESHGIAWLSCFPRDKMLGLGVIDHCDRKVETPETVVARVEAALEHVPVQRLTLNPDCGFSPGVQNPMDLDEAYLKLQALSRAAEILRERYG